MRYLASGMMKKRLTYRELLATAVPPTPFTHHQMKEAKPSGKSAR